MIQYGMLIYCISFKTRHLCFLSQTVKLISNGTYVIFHFCTTRPKAINRRYGDWRAWRITLNYLKLSLYTRWSRNFYGYNDVLGHKVSNENNVDSALPNRVKPEVESSRWRPPNSIYLNRSVYTKLQ